MNPVEITQGKSFKGLSQYLLQDQNRETAERVGWVQTFNLADADGDQAWRLMLATANSANALKEAAGIKKGKAVKNTVYHYSINFNPDDELTEDIQRRAVADSLKALGLEDHQALAVEHTDKAHNHIHVMVNLIDPSNGMSAASPQLCDDGKKRSKLSNSQRKLSKFAAKFERDNGLVITEGRLANANKRAQGEDIDAKRKSRNVHDSEKREKTADRRRDLVRNKYKDRAVEIQEKTRLLKEQCASEWAVLKEGYVHEKEAIRKMMSPTMKQASATIKAERKSDWRTLFRKQQAERHHFDRDSKKAIHRIWYGAVSVREMVREGKHFKALTAAFSTTQQRDILMMMQDKDRSALARDIKAEIKEAHDQVKKDFDATFKTSRERFLDECSDLRAQHDEAWADIKSDWKTHNKERREAFDNRRDRQEGQERGQERGMGMGGGRGRTPT